MTNGYWCILFATLLPYVFTIIAKSGMKLKENQAPREYLKKREGYQKRADWAQQNSFEGLPGFIGAVLVAHAVQAPQASIDILAGVYVLCRVIYGAAYILNFPYIRSLAWGVGILCIIGMFVAGAGGFDLS